MCRSDFRLPRLNSAREAERLRKLRRRQAEMADALGQAKVYFAEETKASADECFSRWSTFLGQVDVALQNIASDAKRRR